LAGSSPRPSDGSTIWHGDHGRNGPNRAAHPLVVGDPARAAAKPAWRPPPASAITGPAATPQELFMTESHVVLVTGASQGIGAAAARAFAAAGHRVVLAARNAEKLEAVRAGLGADGERCAGFACDVTDPSSVEALFARIGTLHGRLDVLFNNAGTNVATALAGDVSWEDWRRVLSVNLDGAFLVASAAFRMMRDQDPQGGRIINNGSISAHAPRYGSAPYTASKHAITGLTRSLSLDGRAFGIACGQIDIGNAASSMTARMSGGVPQADGHLAPEPTIDVGHVADAVVRMAALPLDVNVQFMTIMATTMPFIGRG
jgi:NAD(P)-dependent dehydrogenase (short-subunit alcohol dehydrogenase family)